MSRRGTSFIDLVVSMAIVAVLFGGIYLVYFSLINAVANVSVRTAAASAISSEIETVRDLPYANIGTVGGIPAGVIPATQSVSVGGYTFTLQTTILNIDDPFDGTPDSSPADYKLVQVQATCALCSNFSSMNITTTVAPKGLENATQNGSLFVFAVDANGNPVASATVQVINASVTPSINLTDTTNASGILQLVGAPTSTQGYAITVTKGGYSTAQTYPSGASGNPNPIQPNATVIAQTVTNVTLAIDRVSTTNIYTSDNRCVPFGSEPFSVRGTKLIGTNPNVLKFSTTSVTNSNGTMAMGNMEWDTYQFLLNDAAKDVAGTIPLNPVIVNPSSTVNFRIVVQPAADPSLLATVTDVKNGATIQGATVTVSSGAFSATQKTGHSFVTQNNWSGNQYNSKSAGADPNSQPGNITLLVSASGTYPVNSNDWLVSNTFDLGGSASSFYGFTSGPASEPAGTTISFQIAANNDNATWNFIGPDGTGSTFFASSSTAIPSSLNGNRYFRYKVYLNSTNPSSTPTLNNVSFEFSADCVPPGQTLFTNLTQATYVVNVTAPNYAANSSTVPVGAGEATTTIPLTHL